MANLAITATSVVSQDNASVQQGSLGEAVTAGQAVYRSSTTQLWMLADSNSVTPEARRAIGIALNGGSTGQPVNVQTAGKITIGATLTAGTDYYLSDTPGAICPRADVGSGEYVCLLGLASSTTVLDINVQFPGVAL